MKRSILTCEVLEAPRGNWVKVSIPVQGRRPFVTWVNISRYDAIVPESGADRRGVAPQRTRPAESGANGDR
jgi:hypothetical protein